MGLEKTTSLPGGTYSGYPEAASLTTTQGSNKDLTIVSDFKNATGNAVTVAYVKPGAASQALSVGVSGNAITVNLATDGSSAAASTALQIRDALNASTPASALITASLAPGSTGAGIPSAFAAAPLTGGRTRKQGSGSTGWSYVRATPRPNAKY